MSNFGHHIKCPVAGCPGFYTTTGNPNIIKHIRSTAASETLMSYLLDKEQGKHAVFLKENIRVKEYTVSKVSFDEKVVSLKLQINPLDHEDNVANENTEGKISN